MEELTCKIKTLKFRMGKTNDVIGKHDKEALERQRLSVTTISTMVNTLKENIEEGMFTKGDTEEQVKDWAAEMETLLAQADQCVRKITKELKDMQLAAEEATTFQEQQKKLEFEKLLTEQKLKQEQQAAQEKMELELEYQQKLKDVQETATKPSSVPVAASAKMPKLVISKFDGTPQDWMRFWGQFEAQIDKSSVDAVTKFSYLKELVEVKVRRLIDRLPFNEEGYSKAKVLLEKKYGQTSEVVGAYVRSILELPTIRERDVPKIHAFYETLPQDEKSDLQYIRNPVRKCRCRKGNNFAIVRIHVPIFQVLFVKRYLLTNALIFPYTLCSFVLQP